MKKPKAGIIGIGNVGKTLYARLLSSNFNVVAVADSTAVYADIARTNKLAAKKGFLPIEKADIIFLAIPTFDNGETAYRYISSYLKQGIPVVTCEKGSLANFYSELEYAVQNKTLGYGAVVGSGLRLLNHMQERTGRQIYEIHAILNGTLNYIFDEISRGRRLGEAVLEASRLGYTEPGSQDLLSIINRESGQDVVLKTCALFNIANLSKEKIRAKEIHIKKVSIEDLKKLEKEAGERRYIVSITRTRNSEEKPIGGFEKTCEEWRISAGFKRLDSNMLFKELLVTGVYNALLTSEGEFGREGIYRLTGPGAGAEATSSSMLSDAERILSA